MNLFQYSNGWGHLIISIVLISIGALFVLLPSATSSIQGVGISLVLTVSGAWFIPGAAKQVLNQVQQNTPSAAPTEVPKT